MSARQPTSAMTRLSGAVVAGLAVGVAVGTWKTWPIGVLTGIAAGGGLFVISGWLTLWPLDADATYRHSDREDFRPRLEEMAVTISASGGLLAVVLLLVLGNSGDAATAALALGATAMSWASLHLMYAARYANCYYRDTIGGIDFNSDARPTYRDFLYFSYNLGMTYQISDTAVSDPVIRSVVLRHCLLSYVFGTAIMATMINLVVGIVAK
ncbi:DUF1345 domain-containing protein [Skermania piniformis]|uniref:DUF1345 domain-containing protein n=1 Tax=Skermania pinensis TaxID=39122 RepID=A0ABX8S758_9ACTN|nr:DUF1345 domain-containing protein [Skermania piniformis]QXQ12844.1 DUF1345 domain-containing protein [Skermania piniformis]